MKTNNIYICKYEYVDIVSNQLTSLSVIIIAALMIEAQEIINKRYSSYNLAKWTIDLYDPNKQGNVFAVNRQSLQFK